LAISVSNVLPIRSSHSLSSVVADVLFATACPLSVLGSRQVSHSFLSPGPRSDYVATEPDTVIRQLLSDAFSRLHEFPSRHSHPSLSALVKSFRFRPSSTASGMTCPPSSMRWSRSALTSPARPLDSLSLTRLPPIHLAQYDHPSFLSLRANLALPSSAIYGNSCEAA
jgi:hypothetical protein